MTIFDRLFSIRSKIKLNENFLKLKGWITFIFETKENQLTFKNIKQEKAILKSRNSWEEKLEELFEKLNFEKSRK